MFIYCIFALIVVTSIKDRQQLAFTKRVERLKPVYLAKIEDQLQGISKGQGLLKEDLDALKDLFKKKEFEAVMDWYFATIEPDHAYYGSIPVFMEYFLEALLKKIKRHKSKSDVRHIYMVYQFGLYRLDDPRVIHYLLDAMRTNSLYCKYNAIKAISNIGHVPAFIEAFRIMAENEDVINQKVLLDILGYFNGDADDLYDGLVKEIRSFSDFEQSTIIDSCRMHKRRYMKEFYDLLHEETTDKEVIITLIRYFGRLPMEAVYETLMTYLKHDEWEYRAIASVSLLEYDQTPTYEALALALEDPNWHVRFNSAHSLLALDRERKYVQQVLDSNDQYAIDAINYVISSQAK